MSKWRGPAGFGYSSALYGDPTVQDAPQREYCHDYGAEHQGDDAENVFAFHLPRPLALHRDLHIKHISMTDDWYHEETDDPLYADRGVRLDPSRRRSSRPALSGPLRRHRSDNIERRHRPNI